MNIFSFLFGRGSNGKKAGSAYLMSEEAKRAAAWIETTNPLRGMTATRMQALFDASRNGDTVHLQWLYNEIERVDPTLLICAARRRGALASLDWSVKTRSEGRSRHFDQDLADEQAKVLEAAFGEAELGGFSDALEHLATAFFRGFAHVLPKWSADGLALEGFETLDNWNFVRDLMTGTWYWNPEANAYTDYGSCRPIPKGELLSFVVPYHIDYPMMTIYLRQAVGEKGWAKFTERFGIPPVILTMPEDIPSDQVDYWRAQAEKVAEGGSGAVPAGTQVNFCDGARGINPFKDFIHNQRELTVLMATGGLLTSLAQSGSGTLAGGAHSDTWAEVRRMDSAKIASAINRQLTKTILERAFPGRPQLVYFDFDTEATPSPGEVFDDAAKARTAGYLIDQAELEEKTGYKLVREQAAGNGLPGMGDGEIRLNKEPKKESNADILAAFADDLSPAAKAVEELLKDPSKEKAEAILKDLPRLLPEDPAMAAVIAEAMAAEFGAELEKNAISHPCPKCKRQLRRDGGCTSCERQALLTGKLRRISPNEAKSLLSEPVSVKNPSGFEVRFSREKLLADDAHLKAHHNNADYERRARVMLYAVDAAKTSRDVRSSRATKPNKDGVYDQRKEIRKKYTNPKSKETFEVVVLADNNGEVYEVFDVYPR